MLYNRKKTFFCPVADHAELGTYTVGLAATFVCRECGFAFPIDEKGKLQAPVKVLPIKKTQKCGCWCGR